MKRFALLVFSLVVAASAVAQTNEVPSPLYKKRWFRDPDGIGKTFVGREIAQVMGHEAAGWLERPGRGREERTDLLVEALDLEPGMNVADIGCGTGYHVERIAPRILPGGVVFGVDIQQEMLDLLVQKMRAKGIENVKPVLGGEADPKLEPESCDLIFMVDVYHEIAFPYEMMRKVILALKPGGRLVLVEYRAEDRDLAIKPLHKMSEAQVRKEMALHPEIEWVKTKGTLPQQHVIVFRSK